MYGNRDRDDAALTVLGRLLLVAMASGMIIGGLAAQLLAGWTETYGAAPAVMGALVGMPVALVTQTLNAIGLTWARRLRPGISRTAMRAVLVPLPTLVAPATAAGVVGVDGGPSWVLLIGVPTFLTAVTAWAAARWCLAPL